MFVVLNNRQIINEQGVNAPPYKTPAIMSKKPLSPSGKGTTVFCKESS